MGMHFSKALYNTSTDIDLGAKKIDAALDFNHDGKVDWKDVWDYFKSIGGPEELNILKQRLIPIIELITLPLPSGLTLIIKLVIEALINGINFTQLETAQERKEALHNLKDDLIKAVVSGVIKIYHDNMPDLIDHYLKNNPALREEIQDKLLRDPAFHKEVIEALRTPSAPAPVSSCSLKK